MTRLSNSLRESVKASLRVGFFVCDESAHQQGRLLTLTLFYERRLADLSLLFLKHIIGALVKKKTVDRLHSPH